MDNYKNDKRPVDLFSYVSEGYESASISYHVETSKQEAQTKIKLMPHQIEDAKWMVERKICGNFSDMGTGKTFTTLEACRLTGAKRILVIAPKIALHMWVEESVKILNIKATAITKKDFIIEGDGLYSIAYKRVTQNLDTLKNIKKWLEGDINSVIVCDESHQIKTKGAKQTERILAGWFEDKYSKNKKRRLRGNRIYDSIRISAKRLYFLTGTPMTRWHDDFFPFLMSCHYETPNDFFSSIIHEGKRNAWKRFAFGNFKKHFCLLEKGSIKGNCNEEDMKKLLFDSGFAVRRQISDIEKDLPPITFTRYKIEIEHDDEVAGIENTYSKEEWIEMLQENLVVPIEHKANISTARRNVGEAKIESSVEYIKEEMKHNRPIIVGAWHKSVIEGIYTEIKENGNCIKLTGKTTDKQRKEYINDFNNGNIDVLIGQIKAMGVGINLQRGGNRIIVVEPSISPAEMNQFYARIHRKGQTKHVHVDWLYADCNLEEALYELFGRKANSFKLVMNE